MADYVKTTWVNEAPTGAVKYAIVDDVAGEIADSATIQMITPVVAGTPVNAENLNHMEDGIFNAQHAADLAQAAADAAQGTADQAVLDAAAAQAAADAAQADADTALTQMQTIISGYAEDNSPSTVSSTNSSTPDDILTISLTLPKNGTILAWASGSCHPDAATTITVQLVIDGTVCATKNLFVTDAGENNENGSISINFRKVVTSGARTIKIQAYISSPGTGYIRYCNIVAMAIM